MEENLLVASDDISVGRALAELLLARQPTAGASDWALSVCGLEDVAARSPKDLPHGRRKLVGVARALARRPRMVLMDEPAAGLDTRETAELGTHLRSLPAEGVTVLLIDHDMGLVLSVCDYVFVLDFGTLIAAGHAGRDSQNDQVITAYLGTQKGQGNGHG